MIKIPAFVVLVLISNLAVAMSLNSIGFVPVPVLDDLGLGGLAVVVALVGAIAVRRRGKKQP
jgi:uncharacterized membrane protein YdcZ (DUF606 family)